MVMDIDDLKIALEQVIKDLSELGYELYSVKKEFGYIFMQQSKTSRLLSERIDLLNRKLDKIIRNKEKSISHH